MAGKRGENWKIEEARTWMEMYLQNYNRMDESRLFDQIAHELGKSHYAAKIRFQEIKRILGGEYEYPVVTPNFVQVVNETVESGKFSLGKLKMIFD